MRATRTVQRSDGAGSAGSRDTPTFERSDEAWEDDEEEEYDDRRSNEPMRRSRHAVQTNATLVRLGAARRKQHSEPDCSAHPFMAHYVQHASTHARKLTQSTHISTMQMQKNTLHAQQITHHRWLLLPPKQDT